MWDKPDWLGVWAFLTHICLELENKTNLNSILRNVELKPLPLLYGWWAECLLIREVLALLSWRPPALTPQLTHTVWLWFMPCFCHKHLSFGFELVPAQLPSHFWITSRSGILSYWWENVWWCTVVMYCGDVLWWCAVVVYSGNVLWWCTVVAYCAGGERLMTLNLSNTLNNVSLSINYADLFNKNCQTVVNFGYSKNEIIETKFDSFVPSLNYLVSHKVEGTSNDDWNGLERPQSTLASFNCSILS